MQQKDDLADDARHLAIHCARFLDENKLEDITVLEVGVSLSITDYFILATGRHARHLKAATDKLLKDLRDLGISRYGVEGYKDGKWVLIDLVDAVVHLFEPESRKFYDLELLWGDCPHLDWVDASPLDREGPSDRRGVATSESPPSLRRVVGDT